MSNIFLGALGAAALFAGMLVAMEIGRRLGQRRLARDLDGAGLVLEP